MTISDKIIIDWNKIKNKVQHNTKMIRENKIPQMSIFNKKCEIKLNIQRIKQII